MRVLALAVAVALVAPAAACADSSTGSAAGQVQETPGQVRSVSVTLAGGTNEALTDCTTAATATGATSTALITPNGFCTDQAAGAIQSGFTFAGRRTINQFSSGATAASLPITVQNGTAPGHIDVAAAGSTINNLGQFDWQLCDPNPVAGETPATAACSASALPGPDQFSAYSVTASTSAYAYLIDQEAKCDLAFDAAGSAGCAAQASQSSHEALGIVAPSALAANPGTSSQRFTVTWTALP